MKLATTLTAPLLASLTTLATLANTAQAQTFAYLFDGSRTNGIEGAITVQYDNPQSTRATIIAALDFSKADTAAIIASDGNCSAVDIVNYKWHIHVKWSSPYTSESLAQCGKALTGNHYDPEKACGPFSEFIDTPECQTKIAKQPYGCNPDAYQKDPKVCEKGDLAGKGGDFHLDENYRVHVKWVDDHYPSVWENTPEWNIILHAVCNKATPRVACALGQAVVKLPSDWKWGSDYGMGGGKGGGYGGDKPYTPMPAPVPAPSPAKTTYGQSQKDHGAGGNAPWTTTPMPAPAGNGGYDQTKPAGQNGMGWEYPGNGQVGGY